MKYLVVDGYFNETGIRNEHDDGWVNPSDLGLSAELVARIDSWVKKYTKEKIDGYSNDTRLDALDTEGMEIALLIKNELPGSKLTYYSDSRLTKRII